MDGFTLQTPLDIDFIFKGLGEGFDTAKGYTTGLSEGIWNQINKAFRYDDTPEPQSLEGNNALFIQSRNDALKVFVNRYLQQKGTTFKEFAGKDIEDINQADLQEVIELLRQIENSGNPDIVSYLRAKERSSFNLLNPAAADITRHYEEAKQARRTKQHALYSGMTRDQGYFYARLSDQDYNKRKAFEVEQSLKHIRAVGGDIQRPDQVNAAR